jgi:hypothetical protein
MLGLAEKLALPFLALFWAGSIFVMCWIVFRTPPKEQRSEAAKPGSMKLAKARRGRPLGSSEKPALSRRRPLTR